jgi:hypothetical protein
MIKSTQQATTTSIAQLPPKIAHIIKNLSILKVETKQKIILNVSIMITVLKMNHNMMYETLLFFILKILI